MRVAGSRPQGPVGQVSRGLGARAPRAWGPAHQQITIFRKPPGGSLAKAWVSAETAASEVGTWRETKPGYPPYPTPPRVLGCKGERKRVFTLSAFGNHPTRPPRSADNSSFHFLFHYPNITPTYYSSYHFLVHYPNITPIYYSSFHFLFHYPNITPTYYSSFSIFSCSVLCGVLFVLRAVVLFCDVSVPPLTD